MQWQQTADGESGAKWRERRRRERRQVERAAPGHAEEEEMREATADTEGGAVEANTADPYGGVERLDCLSQRKRWERAGDGERSYGQFWW